MDVQSLRACSDDKLQLRDLKSISFFEARHVKWPNQDAFAKMSRRHFDVIRGIPLDLDLHEPQRASLCPLTPKLDPYERYFTPVAMILSIVCLHVAAFIIS